MPKLWKLLAVLLISMFGCNNGFAMQLFFMVQILLMVRIRNGNLLGEGKMESL